MYRVYYSFCIQLGTLLTLIDGSIRLMDGINEFEGRLEVYENERWGTVCNTGWNRQAGNVIVVCRQLGFATGRYTSKSKGRNKTFLIDKVICNGQERRLGACQLDVLRTRNCEGRDDYEVNIICERPPSTTIPTAGDLRLMNGKDALEGRVEIFRGNNWLSICQNGWGHFDARVACKQLGFNGGTPKYNAFYGKGYGDPWRVALKCDSAKEKLIHCSVLATTCSPRKTAGVICKPPVQYGSSCEPTEQCEGDSTCVVSEGRQLCQCIDETTMFWDSVMSTCTMRLLFNETCAANTPDSCASNLVCSQKYNDSTCRCHDEDTMFWNNSTSACRRKFLFNETCAANTPDSCGSNMVCSQKYNDSTCRCHDEDTMFWDTSTSACKRKSLHNGTCYEDIPNSCGSNLVCRQQYNGSTCTCQCYDEDNMFWDTATSACQIKNSYNDVCGASGDCDSNLVCRRESDVDRCLCAEQGYSVWNVDDNRCFSVDQLSAMYIRLELTYSEALTYCVNEINGSLATWSHFQLVFANCTNQMADIWLQTISAHQKEMQNKTQTSCQLASMGHPYYNTSCSERINFVCIQERDESDVLSCKDFPLGTMFPEHVTTSHTAVILTIIAIASALLVIGAILSAILYRRKRQQYNRTWNANGHSPSGGLHSFHNNAYDTNNVPMIENPYMEIPATDEPDYANVTTRDDTLKQRQVEDDTLKQRQVKNNLGNDNQYTKVQRTRAGYFDMTGRLCTTPTNVTTGDNIRCSTSTSTAATPDRYFRCTPSTSTDASRDGYTLCSRQEMTPGVYNTFSDITNASCDHVSDDPYDHVQIVSDDEYGEQRGITVNETYEDISGHIHSLDFPL